MARLLLIDDDPAVLLGQVTHLFAPRDIEITLARNGFEGLEEIVRRKPDVILLDVGLPDMPGLDVYRHLRALDARIPVIFVTASSATEIAIEAMRLGAFDYLFKPIDLHQLERVVSEALFNNQLALEDENLVAYAQLLGLDVGQFQLDLMNRTYAPRVREDFISGVRSGVNGTPTFFINGVRHDGAWDLESLSSAFENARHAHRYHSHAGHEHPRPHV